MQLVLILLGIFISYSFGVLSLAMLIVFVAKDIHGYDLVHHLAKSMPKENRIKLIKDLFIELD